MAIATDKIFQVCLYAAVNKITTETEMRFWHRNYFVC
jgi:hypothetical protein